MDFPVPELGEGLYEAELVAWHVRPGDAVQRGQPLMEVITDKATFDVPSPFAGQIMTISAEPGQQIKVGQVVLTYSSSEPSDVASASPRSEITIPPAEQAHKPSRPVLTKASTQKSQTEPKTGKNGNGHHKVEPQPTKPGNDHTTSAAAAEHKVKAAPIVRRIARTFGIELSDVHGHGPDGQILLDDLAEHTKPAKRRARHVSMVPEFGTPGERIRFVGLRRRIAERMLAAKAAIPHYSYVDECEVTSVKKLRETFRQNGQPMTYLPFFVKAVAAGLKRVPLVNSTLDETAGEIVLHDRYDIGIATATPKGLVVPVVRDADQKSLVEIARDIERITRAARNGEAKREDLVGSTFTITSIGGIGGLISTPVINQPEVGILGLGRVVKRPVYDDKGELRPADIIYLSFTFDHRVLDGAVGAVFGNAVIAAVQEAALWRELMAT